MAVNAPVEIGRARIRELTQGEGEKLDERTRASRGMYERARVSLASALLSHPDLLILDEPTVGLDPVLRGELWSMFRRLAETGATLLVSSHVMDEAERCDELLLMREGEVLAQCPPAQLLADTGASDVEGAFLTIVRQREVTA